MGGGRQLPQVKNNFPWEMAGKDSILNSKEKLALGNAMLGQ